MDLEIIGLLMLALVWAAAFAAGAVLLGLGLRGRIIDRRPRCRQCDYLLVGFEFRPTRCTECGAMLQGPARVVLGRRSPHWARALAGAGMILAAACPLALIGWLTSKPAVAAAGGVAALWSAPPQPAPAAPAARFAIAAMIPDPEPNAVTPAAQAPFSVFALRAGDDMSSVEADGLGVHGPLPAGADPGTGLGVRGSLAPIGVTPPMAGVVALDHG